MLVNQSPINRAEHSRPSAVPTASAQIIGAVDMELLNTFEELQLGDGSDLIVELIDLYLQELPRRMEQIHEAAIANQGMSLKRAAHNLKGSSANLGIRQVAQVCQELEQIDLHDAPGTVADLVRLLEQESARATESLVAVRLERLS